MRSTQASQASKAWRVSGAWRLALGCLLAACGGQSDEAASPSAGGGQPAPSGPTTTTDGTPSAGLAGAADAGSTTGSDSGTAPLPSSACGKSPAAAKGDRVITTTVGNGGTKRTTRLHVPKTYDPNKPAMLVLNFHGLSMDATQQAFMSNMTPASDARGFIVAYPEGVGQSFNAGVCCGTAASQNVDDVGFTKALIDDLQREYCIDAKHIHATGMSNGGHFAYRLACEMSDVLGAVAPVAGALLQGSCTPKRPIPILHIHGTSDSIVTYAGAGFRGAEASVGYFASGYGCSNDPPKEVFAKGDATCKKRVGCSADLELCTINGGGHTWPGGVPLFVLGKTSSDLDATKTIIDFFDAHPL